MIVLTIAIRNHIQVGSPIDFSTRNFLHEESFSEIRVKYHMEHKTVLSYTIHLIGRVQCDITQNNITQADKK